ncbi:MAG TPA: hypothetical protein VGN97_23120 [Mesorhizobium sp.]|jgi:hypothetical protein|nr:hypothetical protein [Mesorhizobium sp.]
MANEVFIVMNRQANPQERLSASIRREAGSETTTRFLRSLPMFAAVEPLPTYFRQLLERLDAQEQRKAGAHSKGSR